MQLREETVAFARVVPHMQQEAEVELVMIWIDSFFGEDLIVGGEEGAEGREMEGFGAVDDVVDDFDV